MAFRVLTILLLAPAMAWSMLEIRLHGGYSSYQGEEFATYLSTSPNDLTSIRDQLGYGADVLWIFDDYEFIAGLRLDKMLKNKDVAGTFNSTAGSYNIALDRQVISLMTGYRFLNMKTYFGIVGGLGFSDGTKLTFNDQTYVSTKAAAYWGGLEFGSRTSMGAYGCEFGYNYSQIRDLALNGTNLQNVDGESLSLDMSGPYFKFVISFLFM